MDSANRESLKADGEDRSFGEGSTSPRTNNAKGPFIFPLSFMLLYPYCAHIICLVCTVMSLLHCLVHAPRLYVSKSVLHYPDAGADGHLGFDLASHAILAMGIGQHSSIAI